MNSNESAINAILKGVTYLIDKAIQKAPFDRMVSGVVILKRINTVDIIIDGVTYTNIPSFVTIDNLQINDVVKVIIPQNRLNKMFVLGKIGSIGTPTPTPTPIDAYTKAETNALITNTINALDVSDESIEGYYITQVSETNGKISVAREQADTNPIQGSKKMIESGAVYTALESKINVSDIQRTTNSEIDEICV
jgi:hypothetical protein